MANNLVVSTTFLGIDRMSAPLSRIQNRISSMTRSAGMQLRRLQRTTNRLVKGLKKVGQTALLVGGVAAAGLGQAAAAGINFEQTMVNATVKMGEGARRGTETFKQLNDAALEVGTTTEFTATQAANALNFLAMAGFNAEQTVAALPGVVDLATAAQVGLAQATDIATDSLGVFGLESKDAVQQAKNLARVNDVLAKTATTSNTTISQLFEAMRKGGPVATTLGVSMETVAAMLGTMANAGVKADIAGTAVANSFLNLITPVGEAARVTRRLGLEFKDAQGNLKDMPDVIDELNKKTANLNKTQKAAAIAAIFGREGLAGITKVVLQGGDALRTYRDLLLDATGASAEMAKEQRDTTKGSLNALTAAIEGVNIALFETTKGPMRDAIDLTTQWVRANKDLIAQNIGGLFLDIAENFDTYVERGKQIAIVVGSLWALNLALRAIEGSIAAINLVAAINPFVLLGMAIAGMVIYVDDLIGELDRFPDWGKVLTRPLRLSLGLVKEWKGRVLEALSALEKLAVRLGILDAPIFGSEDRDTSAHARNFIGGVPGLPSSFLPTPLLSPAEPIGPQGLPTPLLSPADLLGPQGLDTLARGFREAVPDLPSSSLPTPVLSPAELSSPQERTGRTVSESIEKSSNEITIKDETGRAEVQNLSGPQTLTVAQTGAF